MWPLAIKNDIWLWVVGYGLSVFGLGINLQPKTLTLDFYNDFL